MIEYEKNMSQEDQKELSSLQGINFLINVSLLLTLTYVLNNYPKIIFATFMAGYVVGMIKFTIKNSIAEINKK